MKPFFSQPIGSRHDKAAFFIAFGVGVSFILVLKPTGSLFLEHSVASGVLDWTVVGLVLLVIVCYTLFIQGTNPRSGASVDRASDNVYYLGLLFTLCSLAYALWRLALADTPGLAQSRFAIELLDDFGLALSSTIAGIFARIYLQQLKNDPQDMETEASEGLADLTISLRASIGQLIADLNSLSHQIYISLGEVSVSVSKTLENSATSSAEAIQKVSARLEPVGVQLSQMADTTATTIDRVTQQLGGAVTSSAETMQTASAHLERVCTQLGRVADTSEAMLRRITQQLGEAVTAHAEAIQKVSARLEPVGAQLGQVADTTAATLDRVTKQLGEAVTSSAEAMQTASAHLNRVGAQLGQAADASKAMLDRVTKQTEEAVTTHAEAIQKVSARLEPVGAQLGQAADASKDMLDRVTKQTEEAVTSSAETMQKMSARLERVGAQLGRAADASKDMLDRVTKQLGEAVTSSAETMQTASARLDPVGAQLGRVADASEAMLGHVTKQMGEAVTSSAEAVRGISELQMKMTGKLAQAAEHISQLLSRLDIDHHITQSKDAMRRWTEMVGELERLTNEIAMQSSEIEGTAQSVDQASKEYVNRLTEVVKSLRS